VSDLLALLDLAGGSGDNRSATGYGPVGKRAFGGQFLAQSLVAAADSVEDAAKLPTSLHLQFLRGGEGGARFEYDVERTYDGRTAAVRRVVARHDGRILTVATISFAAPMVGPEHGAYGRFPDDPEGLAATGPAGPAPGLPPGELDIRIIDDGDGEGFVRRMYWRTTVPMSDDPLMHAGVALFVTDVYMIDPALRVHGHSMVDRTHRSGTTDASVWFHRPIRADQWNLLESRSPAATRGRAVVTATLVGADGQVAATMVQEGLIAARE
jgi:acyl-CoA thioesterase II